MITKGLNSNYLITKGLKKENIIVKVVATIRRYMNITKNVYRNMFIGG